MKKVFQPVTDTKKRLWKRQKKDTKETSENGYKRIANLREKKSKIKKDKGIIALYSANFFVNLCETKNTKQSKVVKESNSWWFNDFLMKKTPVILFDSWLLFCKSNKNLSWKDVFDNDYQSWLQRNWCLSRESKTKAWLRKKTLTLSM